MEESKNVIIARHFYDFIKDSRVSWRKKSTYRKKVKRRISKLRRNHSKKLTQYEEEYNSGY